MQISNYLIHWLKTLGTLIEFCLVGLELEITIQPIIRRCNMVYYNWGYIVLSLKIPAKTSLF